ncbi:hypothetical protein AAG906_012814 [Vitis piasezkii]
MALFFSTQDGNHYGFRRLAGAVRRYVMMLTVHVLNVDWMVHALKESGLAYLSMWEEPSCPCLDELVVGFLLLEGRLFLSLTPRCAVEEGDCHLEGRRLSFNMSARKALLPLARLVDAKKVAEWVQVLDALGRNALSNFCPNGSSRNAFAFRMTPLPIRGKDMRGRLPKPFILPILHRLTPEVLVPDEHHVLKDLPLYEVARATNAKTRGDEDMAANLRADFKKRQRKRLFESIMIVFPPTKKPCAEILCPVPISAITLAPEPLIAAVGTSHVPDGRYSTGKYAHLELGGPFTGSTQLNDDSVECVASIPPRPQAPRASNYEEMTKLLKQVPCFTESEAPMNYIRDLFPATRRVSADLGGDPSVSFVARLPFGIPESVASRIPPMQDYTIIEMEEVVSLAPL